MRRKQYDRLLKRDYYATQMTPAKNFPSTRNYRKIKMVEEAEQHKEKCRIFLFGSHIFFLYC